MVKLTMSRFPSHVLVVALPAILAGFWCQALPVVARAAEWPGSAELGFSSASGNTDVLTLLGKSRIARVDSVSTVALSSAAAYGETDDTKNTQKLEAGLNADYYPWNDWSLFGFSTILNNPFRDIQIRSTNALGVKWTPLSGGRGTFSLSLAGIREYEEAKSQLPIKRRFLYSWRTKGELRLGETVKLTQVTFLVEDWNKPWDDYRIDSDTSLTVSLNPWLDLSMLYALDYENQPRAGIERADRLFATSLVLEW